MDPAGQYFCKGDVLHWLERFARQGRTFHGIILDPPTFSRDDRGGVFRVESHYGELVSLARKCLERDGLDAVHQQLPQAEPFRLPQDGGGRRSRGPPHP